MLAIFLTVCAAVRSGHVTQVKDDATVQTTVTDDGNPDKSVLGRFAEEFGIDTDLARRVFFHLRDYSIASDESKFRARSREPSRPTAHNIKMSFALAGNHDQERVQARFKKVVYGARILREVLPGLLNFRCPARVLRDPGLQALIARVAPSLQSSKALQKQLLTMLRPHDAHSEQPGDEREDALQRCAKLLYASPILEAVAGVHTMEPNGGNGGEIVKHLSLLVRAAKDEIQTVVDSESGQERPENLHQDLRRAMIYFSELSHPGDRAMAEKLGLGYSHTAADGIHDMVDEHVLMPIISTRSMLKGQAMERNREEDPVPPEQVISELHAARVWKRDVAGGADAMIDNGHRRASGVLLWKELINYSKNNLEKFKLGAARFQKNVYRTYALYDFVFSIVDKLGELYPPGVNGAHKAAQTGPDLAEWTTTQIVARQEALAAELQRREDDEPSAVDEPYVETDDDDEDLTAPEPATTDVVAPVEAETPGDVDTDGQLGDVDTEEEFADDGEVTMDVQGPAKSDDTPVEKWYRAVRRDGAANDGIQDGTGTFARLREYFETGKLSESVAPFDRA